MGRRGRFWLMVGLRSGDEAGDDHGRDHERFP